MSQCFFLSFTFVVKWIITAIKNLNYTLMLLMMTKSVTEMSFFWSWMSLHSQLNKIHQSLCNCIISFGFLTKSDAGLIISKKTGSHTLSVVWMNDTGSVTMFRTELLGAVTPPVRKGWVQADWVLFLKASVQSFGLSIDWAHVRGQCVGDNGRPCELIVTKREDTFLFMERVNTRHL